MADILIAAFIAAPAVITYFLKSNAAVSYLSLCAGISLSSFAALDIQRLINKFGFWASLSNINILLIALPFVISLILIRRKTGGIAQLLQLTTALLAGYLLTLSILPLLGDTGAVDLANSSLWTNVNKVQSYGVGAGVGLSLLLVWLSALKKSKKH